MKYLVLYEEYTEYNQFEGEWNRDWQEFATLIQAQNAFKAMDRKHGQIAVALVVEVVQS